MVRFFSLAACAPCTRSATSPHVPRSSTAARRGSRLAAAVQHDDRLQLKFVVLLCRDAQHNTTQIRIAQRTAVSGLAALAASRTSRTKSSAISAAAAGAGKGRSGGNHGQPRRAAAT